MSSRPLTPEELSDYRRRRVHALEREVIHLQTYRAKLERMLALALRAATKNTDVRPETLLALMEEMDALVLEEGA